VHHTGPGHDSDRVAMQGKGRPRNHPNSMQHTDPQKWGLGIGGDCALARAWRLLSCPGLPPLAHAQPEALTAPSVSPVPLSLHQGDILHTEPLEVRAGQLGCGGDRTS
jgi:hypothetical protein